MAASRRLLLFEEVAEVAAWEASGQPWRADDLVLPLEMPVQVLLRRRGIPCQSTLPYFPNASHAHLVVTTERFLRTLGEEARLPAAWRAEVLFHTRSFLEYCMWLVELLHQALTTTPNGIGEIVTRAAQQGTATGWTLTPQERPLGHLAAALAARHGSTCTTITCAPEAAAPTPAAVSEGGGLVAALLRLAARRHRGAVLFATDHYHQARIGRELATAEPSWPLLLLQPTPRRGRDRLRGLARLLAGRPRGPGAYPLLPLPLEAFPVPAAEVEQRHAALVAELDRLAARLTAGWDGAFRYREVDLAPLLATKLTTGFRTALRPLVVQEAQLRRCLRELRPRAVLSPYCIGLFTLLGELAREAGVPAVLVTHGTHIRPTNEAMAATQYRLGQSVILAPTFAYTAVQSPYAQEHLDYFRTPHRPLRTGPQVFGRVQPHHREQWRRRLLGERDGKVVLYGVTEKNRASARFFMFETLDEYLTCMADLVHAVNALPADHHLLFKLHPASQLSEADLRLLLPPCDRLTVLREVPFEELLSAADVVVSFSSTIIEEALTNRLPVVLYDRWQRYRHLHNAAACSAPGPWPACPAYYCTGAPLLGPVLAHALTTPVPPEAYRGFVFQPGETTPLAQCLRELAAAAQPRS
jgi:hypothetical protein